MSQEPQVSEATPSIFKLIFHSISTIVLLILIVCLFILLKLWQPWQPAERTPPQTAVNTEQAESMDNVHYEFYDLLIKQQVSPVPEKPLVTVSEPYSDNASSKPAREQFILITKGLDNPDLTDQQRNKIQMAGFSADVIIEQDEQGNKIYRVIAGPFDTKHHAQQAKQNLSQRGIASVVSTFKPNTSEKTP